MSGEPSMVGWLVIAIAAGLLIYFVGWVIKGFADEKTRSQAMLGAAIIVGLLLLGIFFARTSVHQQATLVPPTPIHHDHPAPVPGGAVHVQVAPAQNPSGVSAESTVTVEHGARMEIHAGSSNSEPTPVFYHQGNAQFAWGPFAVITLAAGAILLVIVSKRNLPAALTGLAIIGGLVLFYRLSERTVAVQEAAQVVQQPWIDSSSSFTSDETRDGTSSSTRPESLPSPPTAPPADSSKERNSEPKPDPAASAEKKNDEVKAERETTASDKSKDETKTIRNEPRPAWVDTPPSMKAGVYTAIVVSGPYSTELECEERLDTHLRGAVMEFASRHLPQRTRFYAWSDPAYLRTLLTEDRYFEQKNDYTYVGEPMLNLYARITIDKSDVAHFESLAHDARVHEAVAETSAGAACLLGVLAVIYGCLRYPCRKKPAAPQPATTETTA